MTGASHGFSRAAVPVWGFSRDMMGRSGSLSCGAREVRPPCVWSGRSRHCSGVMGGTRASRRILSTGFWLSLCFSLSSTCLQLPPPSCHLFPSILEMKNPLSKAGFCPQLCELNQGLLFSCISQKRLLLRFSFSILDAHRISKVLLKITPLGGPPWTD